MTYEQEVRVIKKILQVLPAYHDGTYFIISAGHVIVCLYLGLYAATIIPGWSSAMMRVIQQVCGTFVN